MLLIPFQFSHPDAASNPVQLEYVTLPHQVRSVREALDLSQRALADLLGTTESTVSRLERGACPIDTRWASHLTLLFAHLTRKTQ